MSGSRNSLDKRVGRAFALLLAAPLLMVPQAMKAVDFTPDKSADQTTQMKVRRASKRAREQCEDTTAHTPPPVSVVGVGLNAHQYIHPCSQIETDEDDCCCKATTIDQQIIDGKSLFCGTEEGNISICRGDKSFQLIVNLCRSQPSLLFDKR